MNQTAIARIMLAWENPLLACSSWGSRGSLHTLAVATMRARGGGDGSHASARSASPLHVRASEGVWC